MRHPRRPDSTQTHPSQECAADPVGTSASACDPRRAGAASAGALICTLLAACAGTTQIRTLATGRADVVAYALDGKDMDALRAEVARLCPLGGEVLRQSVQGQRAAAPAEGRVHRALQAGAQWIDPPQQSAQMVVACREPGERMRIASGGAGQPAGPVAGAGADAGTDTGANRSGGSAISASVTASSNDAAAALRAPLPVGPVMPKW